jgi:purine nucleosidase
VVAGNAPLSATFRNALRVCTLLGSAVPVLRGADRPLDENPPRTAADTRLIHGGDGMGDVPASIAPLPSPGPAAGPDGLEQLTAHLTDAPGCTVVTLGPLTNIATVLRRTPRAAASIDRLVAMGGAFACPGNVTPVAEFNVWADPIAAAEVGTALGERMTWVGLDVTMQVLLPREAVETRSTGPLGAFIAAATAPYMRFYAEADGLEGCPVHDALAVLAVDEPEWLATELLPVRIETGQAVNGHGQPSGPCLPVLCRGQSVADRRRPGRRERAWPVNRVAMAVDPPRAQAALLAALYG